MAPDMEKETRYIELIVEPIPPDTISSLRNEVLPIIEEALDEAGKEELLEKDQIQIEVEETFPTDEVIVIGLTLLSGIALETYKQIILPKLKERFRVRQKQRRGSDKE